MKITIFDFSETVISCQKFPSHSMPRRSLHTIRHLPVNYIIAVEEAAEIKQVKKEKTKKKQKKKMMATTTKEKKMKKKKGGGEGGGKKERRRRRRRRRRN